MSCLWASWCCCAKHNVLLFCCCAQEVTRSWFSSLFCTALPAETAVRIWDVLFLEGPKILFRVALALFKVCLDGEPSP